MTLPREPVFTDPDRPLVVASFDGWSDAGSAATRATDYLAEAGGAEVIAALELDDFHDYQVHRPVTRGTGEDQRIEWPGARVHRATIGGRVLLLVNGPEPSFRWRAYVDAVLGLLLPHDPQGLVVLASHLGSTPHTRPIPVGTATTSPELLARGVGPLVYQGPVGVSGVLANASHQAGLPALTAYAMVPDYLASEPFVGAAYALVEAVARLGDVRVPLEPLRAAVAAERAEHDDDLRDDLDLGDYVGELEQRWEESTAGTPVADAVEQFLRHQP